MKNTYRVSYELSWRKFKKSKPVGAVETYNEEPILIISNGNIRTALAKAEHVAFKRAKPYKHTDEHDDPTGMTWKPIKVHVTSISQDAEIYE